MSLDIFLPLISVGLGTFYLYRGIRAWRTGVAEALGKWSTRLWEGKEARNLSALWIGGGILLIVAGVGAYFYPIMAFVVFLASFLWLVGYEQTKAG